MNTPDPTPMPTQYPTGDWNSVGEDELKADSLSPGVVAGLVFSIILCVVAFCVVYWYIDLERSKLAHHDVEVRKSSYEAWHRSELIEKERRRSLAAAQKAGESLKRIELGNDGDTNGKEERRTSTGRKPGRTSATPEMPGNGFRISAIPGAGEDNPNPLHKDLPPPV